MTLERINNKLYNFGSELVGSRILDLYLKYNGIKMLTTATLVPLALILGKDLFEDFIISQKGGKLKIPDDLPIIDDPLIGNSLKFTGISTLGNITPSTLVPLGILMFIYNLYINNINQQGGSELMKYVKNIWGNRVLDLFLKYKGITLLTPSTMVPIGLILGKDLFEDILVKEQQGGSYDGLPNNLPILDDPLIGNFLKLSGISILDLNPTTLVPIGLVALLYNIYMEI